jgi:hypothetical protein
VGMMQTQIINYAELAWTLRLGRSNKRQIFGRLIFMLIFVNCYLVPTHGIEVMVVFHKCFIEKAYHKRWKC